MTALYDAHAQQEVLCALSFDYGAKHNDRELPFAAGHAADLRIPHEVIRLEFIEKLFRSDLLRSGGDLPTGHYQEETMKATVVPFRNGIMLSIAAGFAESVGASGLVIAAHAGDHAIYPDCREEFMQSMSAAIRVGTYAEISLWRPFIKMSKAGIAIRGSALGVDYARTWSCYAGGERHCGACGTCVERREAFLLARLNDPTVYDRTAPLPAAPDLR